MRKALVLGKRTWLFSAHNKGEERLIANQILALEAFCGGRTMTFRLGKNCHRAIVVDADPEQREMLKSKAAEVIEIKRRRPPNVLCLIRNQTERETPENHTDSQNPE